ncbi:unnamed protein product [Macrosiphum euphorbiae]|uniref:Uncharacterized protein n=1 Tax=Macrosiphum euphorbiae TaxID=13131 RepID=A0AAV0XIT3_9HEMI|nr:unnamed protein product [Macrosiphum euphorbiae]
MDFSNILASVDDLSLKVVDISSNASTTHGNNSTKSLTAVYLSTQRVAHKRFNDLDDGLRSLLAIASKSILWRLSVLKKQCIFSTTPKQFLTACCSHDEDTAKFNVWAAQ